MAYIMDLPDRAYVYQMDGEAFQDLVNKNFDRNSRAGIQTRFWLHHLEHHRDWTREKLINKVPKVLKLFLERYAYLGFEDFVDSIRIIMRREENYYIESLAEYHCFWRCLKIATFILHNMKIALNRRYQPTFAVGPYEWRSSSILNDWGMLPNRVTRFIDPPPFPRWRYEWQVAAYHGNDHERIRRTAMMSAFRNLIICAIKFERLVKERVELAIYRGRRRAAIISRTTTQLTRIHQSSFRTNGVTRYLLDDFDD